MNTLVEVTGTVVGVFAHRFALDTPDGKVLADLGPAASRRVVLGEGDRVTIEGERKPSEIKVSSIVGPDGQRHAIEWPRTSDRGGHAEPPGADPAVAVQAVEAAGFTVLGEPQRKPKHWEIAAQRAGQGFWVHVALDGTIRKQKPLAS